jgi:Eukaryotic and archaeal DNA primase, large subunit
MHSLTRRLQRSANAHVSMACGALAGPLRYLGPDFGDGGGGAREGVTAAQIPSLARQSFPLCMLNMYKHLEADRHLRHSARLQLGLFLKARQSDCLTVRRRPGGRLCVGADACKERQSQNAWIFGNVCWHCMNQLGVLPLSAWTATGSCIRLCAASEVRRAACSCSASRCFLALQCSAVPLLSCSRAALCALASGDRAANGGGAALLAHGVCAAHNG